MIFGMPYLLETKSLEEACALCAELGLAFVELNANFPACQAGRLDADELRRLKEQYGIGFTFHVEEEFDPFAFQRGVRAAWVAAFQDALRLAKALEMPIVNMHLPHGVYITLPAKKVYLYEQYRKEYRAGLAEFRQLCEAELLETGTHICIENTNGFRPHEQEAVDFLLESSVFGLTLDIGHLHGADRVDLPYYEKNAGRLMHMHGHDATGRKDHLALGDGETDLKAYFAWARRNQARVVLETKTMDALRTSVARLQQWL